MSEERSERDILAGIETALVEIAGVIVEEHNRRYHRPSWRARLSAWWRKHLGRASR